jgi:hypothetical protein
MFCVCVFFLPFEHHAFVIFMLHHFIYLFIYLLFIPSFECHAFVIFMFHGFFYKNYLFLPSFEHHAIEVVDPIHDTIDSFYLDARLMTMPSMIIGVRISYVISRFFFLGVHFFLRKKLG